MQASATCGSASCDDVVAAIVAPGHVLLPADVDPRVLDDIATRLAAARSRVLRPTTLHSLTLKGLLTELVKHADPTPLAGPDLERGFELLTDPEPGCDRIVLVLDRADALDPAALRYVQLATRDAPLQLLFSGGTAFRALLAWEEFGHLRRGFAEHAPAHDFADAAPPIEAAVPIETPAPVVVGERLPEYHPANPLFWSDRDARRNNKLEMPADPLRSEQTQMDDRTYLQMSRWLLAAVGMAASVAAVAWLMHTGHTGLLADSLADTRLLLLPPTWTSPQR